MTAPHLTATLTFLLTTLVVSPAPARADEAPPKLRTQTVSFKLAREESDVRGRERAIELVLLPAGTIALPGADGKDKEHTVNPVWIARYETRWDEYNAFWMGLDMTEKQWRAWWDQPATPEGKWRRWRGMDERPERPYMAPYEPNGESWGIAGYPPNCIHVQAAMKYCAWLSKLTGRKFRLPTEAEWEYACRAGGPPLKPDPNALKEIAWFKDNADDKPHPVGKKKPNAWGLYDMLGNVREYVIRDPKDDKGLVAGGSFADDAKDVHSAARKPYSPDWQNLDPQDPKSTNWFLYNVHHIGFRVVMEE